MGAAERYAFRISSKKIWQFFRQFSEYSGKKNMEKALRVPEIQWFEIWNDFYAKFEHKIEKKKLLKGLPDE